MTFIALLFSVFGLTRMNLTGNLSDDFNKRDALYKDLKYFENKYKGVLPLEILVDTKKKMDCLSHII